ncbi:MAG: PspC domain-containing protein [Candidatus Bipolaricaulia bacterium]
MLDKQTTISNRGRSQPRRLVKSETDKMLFGVAGGLAEYLGMDPVLVRVAFVVLCFASGIGLLAYIILAVLMPSPETAGEEALPTLQGGPALEKGQASLASSSEPESRTADNQNDARRRRNAVGLILVVIGTFFLTVNFNAFFWMNWGFAWALTLIAIGAALLVDRWRRV